VNGCPVGHGARTDDNARGRARRHLHIAPWLTHWRRVRPPSAHAASRRATRSSRGIEAAPRAERGERIARPSRGPEPSRASTRERHSRDGNFETSGRTRRGRRTRHHENLGEQQAAALNRTWRRRARCATHPNPERSLDRTAATAGEGAVRVPDAPFAKLDAPECPSSIDDLLPLDRLAEDVCRSRDRNSASKDDHTAPCGVVIPADIPQWSTWQR
jgi:hypothetical protein